MSGSTAWLVLVAASVLAGASLVGLLIVRQQAEVVTAAAGAISLGAAMYAVIEIGNRYGRVDALLYALAFLLAGLGGGWSLASSMLDFLTEKARLPELPSHLPDPMSKPAVFVVTCFEPERYGPRATSAMIKTLSDEGLLAPSMSTLPFFYFAQKARYRAIGSSSPARSQMVRVAERLQAALGFSPVPSVSWANCSGPERLATRVAEAVGKGHRKIVVVELSVGESLHMAAAKREVDALRLHEREVDVTYTGPLGDSDPIAAFLSRRLAAGAKPIETTGIVLIGHGQPDERARLNPDYDEDENAFLNRVRLMLIEEGFPQDHVRVAWAEWRQPDVTSAVRHLAALGCERVLVSPTVFPLEGLPTRLDLDLAVRHARVDERVIVVTMAAWQDEEAVIAEMARRVKTALTDADTRDSGPTGR